MISCYQKFLIEEVNKSMSKRIGVVGYSAQKFNKDEAYKLINLALDRINANEDDVIVSGLTNIGIPAIAYQIAKEREMKTVGYACSKATEYELFPVDEKYIIGDEWGDESDSFLSDITHLIKIGGGNQSKKEYEKFKGIKLDYNLETINDE